MSAVAYTGKHRGDVSTRQLLFCDWCGASVLEPIRDPVAVSWLGDGAGVWCSTACMASQSEHAVNADAS